MEEWAINSLVAILKRQHILTGKFNLAAGSISNTYIDCKSALSCPNFRKLVTIAMADLLDRDAVAIGGPAMGSIPIATSISNYLLDREGKFLNTFYTRDKTKGHGTGHVIEGMVFKRDKVVIVEDVVTTGMSVLKCIDACNEIGLDVIQILAIVDRSDIDIDFRSVTTAKYDPLIRLEDLFS